MESISEHCVKNTLKEGDLVYTNRYAITITSNLVVSEEPLKQQSLFSDFSLLGVIVKIYNEMCYVYIIKENKYIYLFYE